MTLGTRRPQTVTLEKSDLVGRLMDCQILAQYAEQAIRQATCPHDAAPVSVALDAIGKCLAKLRTETGRLDGAAA